ncbi:MAG: hypothetical protein WC861_03985 [Candidatus Micrarchaeia archaeon]
MFQFQIYKKSPANAVTPQQSAKNSTIPTIQDTQRAKSSERACFLALKNACVAQNGKPKNHLQTAYNEGIIGDGFLWSLSKKISNALKANTDNKEKLEEAVRKIIGDCIRDDGGAKAFFSTRFWFAILHAPINNIFGASAGELRFGLYSTIGDYIKESAGVELEKKWMYWDKYGTGKFGLKKP